MHEFRNSVQEHQSEVAALCARIQAEHEAAWQALYGYGYAAAHAFIHAKYERMGELVENLGYHVGEEAAMELLVRVLDQ
jgi:ABC-type Fe3+-citrate transport system substrate-binding protein